MDQPVTRRLDDFSVFQHPDRTTWGVCGLKLSTDILTFTNRAEATARGTALARASRVSLWFEPTGHLRDGVLVVSYRHEQNPSSPLSAPRPHFTSPSSSTRL